MPCRYWIRRRVTLHTRCLIHGRRTIGSLRDKRHGGGPSKGRGRGLANLRYLGRATCSVSLRHQFSINEAPRYSKSGAYRHGE